jgi:hypothetical protein
MKGSSCELNERGRLETNEESGDFGLQVESLLELEKGGELREMGRLILGVRLLHWYTSSSVSVRSLVRLRIRRRKQGVGIKLFGVVTPFRGQTRVN